MIKRRMRKEPKSLIEASSPRPRLQQVQQGKGHRAIAVVDEDVAANVGKIYLRVAHHLIIPSSICYKFYSF